MTVIDKATYVFILSYTPLQTEWNTVQGPRTLGKCVDAYGVGLCLASPDTKHEPAPDVYEQRGFTAPVRATDPFNAGAGHVYPKLGFSDILYTYVAQTYAHGLVDNVLEQATHISGGMVGQVFVEEFPNDTSGFSVVVWFEYVRLDVAVRGIVPCVRW